MKKKSVLDAYALLAYLNEERGSARVKELLAAEDASVMINAINLGEAYYVLARRRGRREADFLLSGIIPSLPIKVKDNSTEEVIEAARLKARCALSFAAATAVREGAALVTGDPEFRKLDKAVEIDWIG